MVEMGESKMRKLSQKSVNLAEIGEKCIHFAEIGGKCSMHHWLRVRMCAPGLHYALLPESLCFVTFI